MRLSVKNIIIRLVKLLLKSFAKEHRLDPLVLRAILDIETNGTGFENGRLVIRFEPHIFRSYFGNNAVFDKHFTVGNPNWTGHYYKKNGMSFPVHANQDSEHEAFRLAKSLDLDSAYESISMGRGQIMGFNSQGVGYGSAKEMYSDFNNVEIGEINQIIAFLTFLATQTLMIGYIGLKDWNGITRTYNGTANIPIYS